MIYRNATVDDISAIVELQLQVMARKLLLMRWLPLGSIGLSGLFFNI